MVVIRKQVAAVALAVLEHLKDQVAPVVVGKQYPAFTGPLIGVPALAPLNGYFAGGGGGGSEPSGPAAGGAWWRWRWW